MLSLHVYVIVDAAIELGFMFCSGIVTTIIVCVFSKCSFISLGLLLS